MLHSEAPCPLLAKKKTHFFSDLYKAHKMLFLKLDVVHTNVVEINPEALI